MTPPRALAPVPIVAALAALTAGLTVFLLILGGVPTKRSGIRPRPRPVDRRRPAPADSSAPVRAAASVITAATTLALALTIGPFVLLLILTGIVTVVLRIVRRRTADRRRRIDDAAADLIDLFGIALAAGQPVPIALTTVAPRSPPAVRDELMRAAGRFERGMLFSAAVEDLGELGPAHRALVDALLTAHHGGAPVLDSLDRLAESERGRRRRRAEVRARRLPVTMLFPLVVCILPAFGLLAIVPLLVTSFTDLG